MSTEKMIMIPEWRNKYYGKEYNELGKKGEIRY